MNNLWNHVELKNIRVNIRNKITLHGTCFHPFIQYDLFLPPVVTKKKNQEKEEDRVCCVEIEKLMITHNVRESHSEDRREKKRLGVESRFGSLHSWLSLNTRCFSFFLFLCVFFPLLLVFDFDHLRDETLKFISAE